MYEEPDDSFLYDIQQEEHTENSIVFKRETKGFTNRSFTITVISDMLGERTIL